MARRPDPQLHDVWRDRVRRQQTSGLTIERFCAEERIAAPSSMLGSDVSGSWILEISAQRYPPHQLSCP